MKNSVMGVIGGLGPLATAYFMERVVEMTDAQCEQDHVNMIVYNFPSIPDRTGYILGSNLKSPLPGLLHSARALAQQSVDFIAIPCITAHFFHKEMQGEVAIPILDSIADTVNLLKNAGVTRVGIMATDGTNQSRIISRQLEKAGISSVLPSDRRQRDVMHFIYDNVKVNKPAEMDRFYAVQKELLDCGCQVIILGCTELSIIHRDHSLIGNYLDVMDVMARESVLRSGNKLKQEYENLLKGVVCSADQHSGISGIYCRAFAG